MTVRKIFLKKGFFFVEVNELMIYTEFDLFSVSFGLFKNNSLLAYTKNKSIYDYLIIDFSLTMYVTTPIQVIRLHVKLIKPKKFVGRNNKYRIFDCSSLETSVIYIH